MRAQPLAVGGGVVVVGAKIHQALIEAQLAEISVEAHLILEPASRNTTAAIAAASALIMRTASGAVLTILPADHHIPDDAAFRVAVGATLAAARDGAIVTLGVTPSSPSTAYGYIRPGVGESPVKPIESFEEKPDAARAGDLIAAGGLWNTGVFVATAKTFSSEIRRLAAPTARAIESSLSGVEPSRTPVFLAAGFEDAPSIAFDNAVMEQTDRGAVLPVDFVWSDLGAWDAVLSASETDARGNSLSQGVQAMDAHQVLVRASSGIDVAVVGVSRLAVIADGDAVLVCSLDQAQSVRAVSAGGGRPARFESLAQAADVLDIWLRTAALPLWATVGTDASSGGFRESLTWDGRIVDPHRRTRVQARQAFVFASAAADGMAGPWLSVAERGFRTFRMTAIRSDGLYASTLNLSGAQTDPTARLYEHAFVLLALAALQRAQPDTSVEAEAIDLLKRLQVFRHAAGGFREAGAQGFQANASMHLLEAALEWEKVGRDGAWRSLADELVDLALTRFIDQQTGALSEFFDADWRRLNGAPGLIEPGHQFEWAWLLARWGAARSDPRGEAAARRLFQIGRRGFDPVRNVVANALWDDLSIRDAGARLWPQTEHLKAALILGEHLAALEAANAVAAFLDTPARGAWRERLGPEGAYLVEPSPATSLYHLYLATACARNGRSSAR